MQPTRYFILAGICVLGTTLFGCGRQSSLATASSAAALADVAAPGTSAGAADLDALGDLFGLDPSTLALTVAQQARLKAVLEKSKAQQPPAGANSPDKALQAAILAPTVDDATLRAALAAEQADMARAPQSGFTDDLTAVRAVLTDVQRAKIVANIQSAATPAAPAPGSTAADDQRGTSEAPLDLTPGQQAALDAFDAALKAELAANPPPDPRPALIAFWQTGDTRGLTPPARPVFPTEEFVAAVESLDLAQRKALFDPGRETLGLGSRPHPRVGFGRRAGLPGQHGL